MSQPWKLLPLAAIVAVIGAMLLAPGGVAQPGTASAAQDCATHGVVQILIHDIDNGANPVSQPGITVVITPNLTTTGGSRTYVDNGTNDASSSVVGTIREDNACSSGANDYSVTSVTFPTNYQCQYIANASDQTFGVTANSVNTVDLYVGSCPTGTPTATATTTTTVTPTVTGTVTSTPGPASTVTTSASPSTISCSGTSIVTIQVRDAGGNPVPAGTTVTISTSLGSVSPSAGQTTDASGNAFVFLTAPANQGGAATVTALSGNAVGSTTVTINCGTTPTPTTAPPPTVITGGVISPPNTGDGGLADSSSGSSWLTFAGIGLLIAATFGAVGIIKVRA